MGPSHRVATALPTVRHAAGAQTPMSVRLECDHCGQPMQYDVVYFLLDGKEVHIRLNPSDPNMGEDHKDFCRDCLLAAAKAVTRSLTWEERMAARPKRGMFEGEISRP